MRLDDNDGGGRSVTRNQRDAHNHFSGDISVVRDSSDGRNRVSGGISVAHRLSGANMSGIGFPDS